MPFQRLHIQKHSNSFITNFVVCVLMLKLDDSSLGKATCDLFGDINSRLNQKILNELENPQDGDFRFIVESINSRLRPKLLEYAESRREDYKNSFLSKFGSEEALDERIKLLGKSESPSDEFEKQVLSDFMGVKVKVIKGMHPELDSSNDAPNTLYFSHHEGQYYFFVETEFLPEKWLETLPPPIEQPDLPKEIKPETIISGYSYKDRLY